jgi:predicted peptidase
MQTAKQFVAAGRRVDYLLYLSPDYEASGQAFPLLLFLHGRGESGQDPQLLKRHGPPKLVETTMKDFPFILVSPQSHDGLGWSIEALDALLADLLASYRVDPDRVYLTGLSMGGGGVWLLAVCHPERFAAIAPVCGARTAVRAGGKLRHVPVWAFHGARDSIVPLRLSEAMVQAVRDAGGEARLTVYPDAAHDSWTETYNNPELYRWLLSHRRQSPEPS